MFTKTARFYDAVYSRMRDYPREAAHVTELILEHNPNAKTLLDVACGTGAHLEHLRERFECEGVDLDDQMLAVAAKRNPGLPLHQGDMTSFDLGRTFDAVVCLFGSIAYTRTIEGLTAAAEALARHVNAGGILILEPFLTPETWKTGTLHAGFIDEPDLKLMRASRSQAPDGRIVHIDFEYLIMTPDDLIRESERHTVALFTDEEIGAALAAAGLDYSFDAAGIFGDRGLFTAVRNPQR